MGLLHEGVSARDRAAIVPSQLAGTLNVAKTKAEVAFYGDVCDEVLVFRTDRRNGVGDWRKIEQVRKFQCPNRRAFFDARQVQSANITSGHTAEL